MTKRIMISGVTAGSTGNLGTDITKLLDPFIDGDSLTGSGVLDKTVGTHLNVTESAPAAMTVDVAEGMVFIKNNTATVFEKKMYVGYIDADETDIAVAANSSGVNRIDPAIAYVDLGSAAAARGLDHIFLDVLTNAETPTTAAMSDAEIQTALDIITGDSDTPWTRLADITVADSAASILDANISDERTQVGITKAYQLATGLFHVDLGGSDQAGVVSATNTKILFDTERYDENGWFASNKYTPQVEGFYLITLRAGIYNLATTKYTTAKIYLNGAAVFKGPENVNATGGALTTASLATAVVYCNGSTDYIEGFTIHTEGANRVIEGAVTDTFMQGYLIGKAK